MIIKEFRITLPMTVEEYQVAQLYSVAQASKNETGGGEGIEVLKNEPFTPADGVQPSSPLLNGQYHTGQYTHKIYHLASKVPKFVRLLAPKGSLNIDESAWNAYPYCRTIISNPDYMKENFVIKIETIHLPGRGEIENAHHLPAAQLSKREVVTIDIAHDKILDSDYNADEDPLKYKSEKTSRGPLTSKNWQKELDPVMTCYKLVTVEFKWWGAQGRVEKFIQKSERRIFTTFHRQVFCWTDQWYGLSMEEIREIEERTTRELEEAHQLPQELLSKRDVVQIDIAHDKVSDGDYKADEDPVKYKSEKTGRGPLVSKNWKNEVDPVMTCYKLVTVEFKWFGLQGRVEKFIQKAERRIFTNFHRQVFCWTDLWHGLTMKDIREIEERTKRELDEAHGLDAETLRKRETVFIDISNDPVDRRDFKPDEDPSKFKSSKTGRGPLVGPNWKNNVEPVMTCYKLVTVDFKWWGLQGKVEKFIHKAERRIFTNFHRQVFCWTDLWHGLTMQDIREIEDRTKRELDEQIKQGEVRGTREDE